MRWEWDIAQWVHHEGPSDHEWMIYRSPLVENPIKQYSFWLDIYPAVI